MRTAAVKALTLPMARRMERPTAAEPPITVGINTSGRISCVGFILFPSQRRKRPGGVGRGGKQRTGSGRRGRGGLGGEKGGGFWNGLLPRRSGARGGSGGGRTA